MKHLPRLWHVAMLAGLAFCALKACAQPQLRCTDYRVGALHCEVIE